jgi:hypothetical protein
MMHAATQFLAPNNRKTALPHESEEQSSISAESRFPKHEAKVVTTKGAMI